MGGVMSVMIMAGGTGGHVFPALALAQELRARGREIFWLGVPGGFEARIVPAHGIELEMVDIQGLRGNGLARQLAAPFKITRAVLRTLAIIRRRRPGLVVGMGGYVAGPGGVAARLAGVPLVIHEQNRIPGLTNRLLARIARRVLEAFPGTFDGIADAVAVGNPVRREITRIPPKEGIATPARLLVFGGSLGAQALNQALPAAIARLPAELRPEIRHQAGRDKDEETRAAYRDAGVAATVTPFIDDMAEALTWADLAVARAGALTVSELACAGRAAILVPLPHAVDDHQTANARYLADGGAARIVQQSEFDQGLLEETLKELLSEPQRLPRMGQRARELAMQDAAARAADLCLEILEGRVS